MKKMKKVLALLLGAAITGSTAVCSALQADAITSLVTEIKTPDGYELVEMTSECVTYRETENHYTLRYYRNICYNFTNFAVSDGEVWAEIYAKYETALDADRYFVSEGQLNNEPAVWVQFYDLLDEGDTPDIAESIQDKTDVIHNIMNEAFDAGILLSADYSAIQASSSSGQIEDQLRVKGFTGTQDALKAAVAEYYPEATITLSQNENGEDIYAIKDFTSSSVEEMEELCVKIEETFAGSSAHLVIISATSGTVDLGSTVDVLAELKETACDIDGSGTVDISDATAVLLHYANSAAGVIAAAEANMDVNRNGSVDLDDAAAVLQIYAENAAGVDAS